MPSLQALQEFKNSFNQFGGELSSLAEQQIPFDDLPLPGQEPGLPPGLILPAEPSRTETGNTDLDFNLDDFADMDFDTGDAVEAPAGEIPDAGAGSGAMDFGAFLDTIPDDLSVENAPPDPGDSTPADDSTLADDSTPADDFSVPDDLLSGFAEDIESGRNEPDSEPEELDELPAEDFESGDDAPSMDLGGELPDGDGMYLGGELLGGETPADDFGSLSGLEDLGGETPAAGSDLTDGFGPGDEAMDLGGELPGDDVSAMDLGGELPDGETPADDFGSLSGLEDLGGEPPAAGSDVTDDFGSGDEAMDLGSELPGGEGIDFSIPDFEGGIDLQTNEEPASSGDSFDNFDVLGGALPGDSGKADEFTLPGIDDVFAGTASGAEAGPQDLAASGEVEEIQLTEEELEKFRQTLAEYPLNLRIACEELIAEQAVTPEEMSRLVKLLIRGAPAKETAALAGKVLGRVISIPRGFEKKTGEEMEAEQSSFAYIFVHKFMPMFGIFMMIAAAALSLLYLIVQFIYYPLKAESIYKTGIERIEAGEYERANERFDQAFSIHRKKDWFYRYAERFRAKRQYIHAERKYDELLNAYPRDKKGVLDYAAMESTELRAYEKAEDLLRRQILDYAPNDYDALLALGDNSLAWGETDRSKYEDARFSYARLLEKYGWTDPIVERMLKYFIRTDNLKETLPLQSWFMDNKKRKISAETLAELGGYLLDKQLEEGRGDPRIPNEYAGQIEGIREILLRAIKQDDALPESHYHLSRYYHNLENTHEERVTLERALAAFDSAREEPVGRIQYRIDALRRYAELLKNAREFRPAEEQLVKGITIYEDALTRRLFSASPDFGRLYADLGDLVYFTKDGSWETALAYYSRSEQNGWAPPEIQYRMGAAHYLLQEWPEAMERFFIASGNLPLNRRILHALGNTAYQRGNYFAAQGYFNRLLDILEGERSRLPLLLPNERPEYVELAERLMIARNNTGVTLEALTRQTGDNRYRSRALALYTESARAWDVLTRNPQTMTRLLPAPGMYGPGINPAYLNVQNSLYPVRNYEYYFFLPIDRDVLEPSPWEELAPLTYRLSQGDASAAR